MTRQTTKNQRHCWICGGDRLARIKESNIANPSAESFRITDSSYGVTAAIFRCEDCGFLECPEIEDVLSFYQEMDDAEYERTRLERSIQSKKLLELAARYHPRGKLLDVGAGTGILVEQALKMGYDAKGVEPSRWLQARAEQRGLPVVRGVFPHHDLRGPFDLITVIDVIEHVDNPLALLEAVRVNLSKDGLAIVVTPDVESIPARLLGFHWWHYRVAHIGYFSRTTLEKVLDRVGLRIAKVQRPSWYLPADYLVERVGCYLPRLLRPPVPGFLSKIVIPLNLRDSMLVIARPEIRTKSQSRSGPVKAL